MKQANISIDNSKRIEALERELWDSQQELAEFAYIVSHDLNAPFRNIVNFSKLLNDRYAESLDDKANKFLYHIVNSGSQAQEMIAGLLEYSRLNTRPEPFTNFDSSEVVARALNNLDEKILFSHAHIECDYLPTITGDKTQITKLFTQLIDNALKFQKDNTTPRIKIKSENDGDACVFSIQDNGIGIDSKQHERIFGMFKRPHVGSENDKYPGSGVGLAICSKIIQRHKGKIWVESETGNGSTFYFSIPDPK